MLHDVHGNNDGPELRSRLPEVTRFTVEDLSVLVVHETGPARRREERLDLELPGSGLLTTGPWPRETQ